MLAVSVAATTSGQSQLRLLVSADNGLVWRELDAPMLLNAGALQFERPNVGASQVRLQLYQRVNGEQFLIGELRVSQIPDLNG